MIPATAEMMDDMVRWAAAFGETDSARRLLRTALESFPEHDWSDLVAAEPNWPEDIWRRMAEKVARMTPP